MALSLRALVVKHERRIRLVFDGALAIAAFGSSPDVIARFSITSLDSRGAPPSVTSAIAIASDPTNLDLTLNLDLVDGSVYQVTVTAVPAADSSTATGSLQFRTSDRLLRPNREVIDDHDELFYGSDLWHDGTDYVEDADNDLAVLVGVPCVENHLRNGVLSGRLLWAPGYSPLLRHYIDATQGSIPGARQAIDRFFNRDDRVKQVVTTYTASDTPSEAYFDSVITLIGGETLDPIPTKPQGS